MARYLNLVGVSNGVANCIGERTFEPHEVAALKASQKNMQNKAEYDNQGKWHAILLEGAEGKSFMNTELSLAKTGQGYSDMHKREAETKAVEQIIRITGQMLEAGIVNADQWHNILVNEEGEAKFIDMEGANFLTDVPLRRFLADVGNNFKHETREIKLFGGSTFFGKWQVKRNPPPEVLNKDEAERQVKQMVTNIFGLVPLHAVVAAENALRSRGRLRNSLDDIVDEAWAAHKLKLSSEGSGDQTNTDAELPAKVREDYSRPPGYTHLSRSLTRYGSGFRDNPYSPVASVLEAYVARGEEPNQHTKFNANPPDHSRLAGHEEPHRSDRSGDKVVTKGELPPKDQEDYSRPKGYEHFSRSREFNDNPRRQP